ncbi:MAG: hypothetical protein GF398_00515 [Chitinivibrionales bacterium]|nr:hypothetical protein [Chitinivibrionales bacterium]
MSDDCFENNGKVDFAGVGAGRSGTTWVARCLAEHPDVCMARVKEANFFLTRYVSTRLPGKQLPFMMPRNGAGPGWMVAQFAHHKLGQLRGEFSPAYLSDPQTPHLMQQHNPAMKLIVCLRRPTDALYSVYFELSKYVALPTTFEAFLTAYPEFIEYARFVRHIERFLDYFPPTHIFFVIFEDIANKPMDLFKELCDFLDIRQDIQPPSLTAKVNQRRHVRSRKLRSLLHLADGMLANANFTRNEWIRRLRQWNLKKAPFAPLSDTTRRSLDREFYEDNKALARFIGRDLSAWEQ